MDILTKGNVIVNKIKIGDVHYEYEHNLCVKSTVLTKPVENMDGNWIWSSRNQTTGDLIKYLVNPTYPAHYSVNLYDYEAYSTKHYI